MGFLLAGNGLLVVFLTIMVYKKVSAAHLMAQCLLQPSGRLLHLCSISNFAYWYKPYRVTA